MTGRWTGQRDELHRQDRQTGQTGGVTIAAQAVAVTYVAQVPSCLCVVLEMVSRLQHFQVLCRVLFLGIITITSVKVASSLRWYGRPPPEKQLVERAQTEPADHRTTCIEMHGPLDGRNVTILYDGATFCAKGVVQDRSGNLALVEQAILDVETDRRIAVGSSVPFDPAKHPFTQLYHASSGTKPKIVHQIWIQGDPCANAHPHQCANKQKWEAWCTRHNYTYKLWSLEKMKATWSEFDHVPAANGSYGAQRAFLADVMRVCILFKEGGLYVDMDLAPADVETDYLTLEIMSHPLPCVTPEWQWPPAYHLLALDGANMFRHFPSYSLQNNWMAYMPNDPNVEVMCRYQKYFLTSGQIGRGDDALSLLIRGQFLHSLVLSMRRSDFRMVSNMRTNAGGDHAPNAFSWTPPEAEP